MKQQYFLGAIAILIIVFVLSAPMFNRFFSGFCAGVMLSFCVTAILLFNKPDK